MSIHHHEYFSHCSPLMHDIDKILLKMMCLRNLLIVLHTSLGWEALAVCLLFFFFSSSCDTKRSAFGCEFSKYNEAENIKDVSNK